MSHGYWMWPKSTVIDVRETWDLMLFRGTDLNEERTVLLRVSRAHLASEEHFKIVASSDDHRRSSVYVSMQGV